jgi:hypothetical protein
MQNIYALGIAVEKKLLLNDLYFKNNFSSCVRENFKTFNIFSLYKVSNFQSGALLIKLL